MDKGVISDEAAVCEAFEVHNDKIIGADEKIPHKDTLWELSEFFKVFSEVSRLKILYLLYDSELCVCDIARILGSTVSAVSHQLKILKNARLVKFRKEGKNCYYSLADDHISDILARGMEHICE